MCCVAGFSVAIVHPKVNVQLYQELSYVIGEVWDELQLQLDDVSQHLQLLRSRVSSCASAHTQFQDETKAAQRQKITARWETRVVFVLLLLLCFFGVELFTRRNCHYPWMSVQSWFDLVRFDSSDDVFFGRHRRRKLAFVHVLDMMLFFFIHSVSLFSVV